MTDLNFNIEMSGITNDLSIRFPLDDDSTPIVYELLEYMEELGKTDTSNITEASFMIKASPTDDDVTAIYSKILTDAEITKNDTLSTINVLISDFAGLVIDTKYYVALGIKFSGDALFREVPAIKKFIQFKQDVIRA